MMNGTEHYVAGEVVNYLGVPSVVIGYVSDTGVIGPQNNVFAISLKEAVHGHIWRSLPYSSTRWGFMCGLGYRSDVFVFNAARPVQRIPGFYDFGVPQTHLHYLRDNLAPGALLDRDERPSLTTGHFVGHKDNRLHVVITCRCEDGSSAGCMGLDELVARPDKLLRRMPPVITAKAGVA